MSLGQTATGADLGGSIANIQMRALKTEGGRRDGAISGYALKLHMYTG